MPLDLLYCGAIAAFFGLMLLFVLGLDRLGRGFVDERDHRERDHRERDHR